MNSDPYGAGWLIKVSATSFGELMGPDEYRAHAAS